MARPKRFRIDLALEDPDGSPSALADDLTTDRKKRLRRLARLTEDFLIEAKPLPWLPGAEGAWILVPIVDDFAVCQWLQGSKILWELGRTVGRLKVVRIIPANRIRWYLSQAKEGIAGDEDR